MKKPKKAQKKAPETYEEFRELAWASFQSHRPDYIPEANHSLTVGQSVYIGALPDCRIEGFREDNRVIEISRADRGESYGRPYDNHRRLPSFWVWTDAIPAGVQAEDDIGSDFFYRKANFTQTELRGFLGTSYYRGIIDNPDYQRGYVWTLADKQALIKSILKGSDIGKFITVTYPYPENRLEIVDGKQRLSAIHAFYERRFAVDGRTFDTLSFGDRYRFNGLMVQIAELKAENLKKSDILYLFLTLNAGGVPQTEEHLAHARRLYEDTLAQEAAQK